MPEKWKLVRKSTKWMLRHDPTHEFESSMSLNLIFKDLLNIAKTSREAKHILNNQEILVDGRRRKEMSYSCGILDVINVPLLKENYRMMIDTRGKILALKITDADAKIKPVKIIGKTILKGGKMQLNLSDGRTMLVNNPDYKMGDTLVISLPEQKVQDHIQFDKKHMVYLIGGNHAGKHGEIIDFKDGNVIIKTKEGHNVETLKKYALVIGKNKPCIKLIENE